MKQNGDFYMANVYPEVGRLFEYHKNGDEVGASRSYERALKVVGSVLSSCDVPTYGKEEWWTLRNLISSYKVVTEQEKNIIFSFVEPFSCRFMKNYQL